MHTIPRSDIACLRGQLFRSRFCAWNSTTELFFSAAHILFCYISPMEFVFVWQKVQGQNFILPKKPQKLPLSASEHTSRPNLCETNINFDPKINCWIGQNLLWLVWSIHDNVLLFFCLWKKKSDKELKTPQSIESFKISATEVFFACTQFKNVWPIILLRLPKS